MYVDVPDVVDVSFPMDVDASDVIDVIGVDGRRVSLVPSDVSPSSFHLRMVPPRFPMIISSLGEAAVVSL